MNLQLDAHGNPIIDQLSEEGFVDLTLRIAERVDDEKSYCLRLAASHNNSDVGFDVVIDKGIKSGFDSEMHLIQQHVSHRGIRFIRSGAESDRLIAAIALLYGASTTPERMVAEEVFTAIALHQGDLDFETERIHLKLFGKDGEPFVQDDYYESFLNVDLANRIVFWNEKDPDYREPLLRALSEK